MSAQLIVLGALLCFASALVSLVVPRRTQVLTAVIQVSGGIIGLAGCIAGFRGAGAALRLPWQVPMGVAAVRVDALSAFFAAPVFLLGVLGAVYAERYWPSSKPRAAYVRCFFGIATGALSLVLVAANTLFFVALWEIVALACFFLVGTDTADADARGAAWLYLAASHIATLTLFGLVTLLHSATGTWSFVPLSRAVASSDTGSALFWLAIVAFGIKAGMMPFHVWLPAAHAAAPTHVSAVMSGVVIKMGIYGLVRVLSLYPAVPDWMGGTVLTLGIISSILGVAFALAQHDLKRLLAYHSIENIGIILAGLGVGYIARGHGLVMIAMLGFAGGLLHVWNHGLFKALLFFGAGSAIHATHTREIDRMGGLARRMPMVAAGFLTGAVAISGLPPLNGFVSEWLIYVAGFKAVVGPMRGGWAWLLLLAVVPALALTGALALACFVKAFGAVFLGNPRTREAAEAGQAPASMRLAMVPLVLACVAIGVVPVALAPLLSRIVAIASGVSMSLVTTLAPLQRIAAPMAFVLAITVSALVIRLRRAPRTVTWDCGYARPTARMQYSSSSTARTLVAFFAWVMPPSVHAPGQLPLFPAEAALSTHMPDTVLDRGLLPALRRLQRIAGIAHYIQSGRVQLYLVYLGVTLLALLVWSLR